MGAFWAGLDEFQYLLVRLKGDKVLKFFLSESLFQYLLVRLKEKGFQ